MIAKIHITFKNGVLDPQGKAVHHALKDLGYNEVSEIQMGKYLELKLDGVSQEEAESRIKEMCEKLFANTVIESYRFTLETAE
jgi:phosphoribosylformylglycinamidine synthase